MSNTKQRNPTISVTYELTGKKITLVTDHLRYVQKLAKKQLKREQFDSSDEKAMCEVLAHVIDYLLS